MDRLHDLYSGGWAAVTRQHLHECIRKFKKLGDPYVDPECSDRTPDKDPEH